MSQNLATASVSHGPQTPLQLATTPVYSVASTWRRLGANLIDGMLMGVLWIPAISFEHFREGILQLSPALSAVAVTIALLYHPMMLKRFSRTLGKMAMGLTIVDHESGKPELTWNQAFSRSVPQLALFFISSALIAVALLRTDRRHVFDLLADTQVMQTTPRAGAPSKRWIIGVVAVLFYGLSGISSFTQTIQSFLNGCPNLHYQNGTLIYNIKGERTCK